MRSKKNKTSKLGTHRVVAVWDRTHGAGQLKSMIKMYPSTASRDALKQLLLKQDEDNMCLLMHPPIHKDGEDRKTQFLVRDKLWTRLVERLCNGVYTEYSVWERTHGAGQLKSIIIIDTLTQLRNDEHTVGF